MALILGLSWGGPNCPWVLYRVASKRFTTVGSGDLSETNNPICKLLGKWQQ